jgi:hypothetical protein
MDREISIVVFANAKDFFLSKICISSIRYFYPEIEIFIVKDELNGKFNTRIVEQRFNVKLLKLSKKYFGWAAAKLHFLIEVNEDKSFLCLDSDIVFVGNVLNKLKNSNSDFIVSSEFYDWTDTVKRVFVDPDKIINYYPMYRFPGFFFNGGQTLVNPSKIRLDDFNGAFNPFVYPYYMDFETFNCVDQSILNGLLPALYAENRITLEGVEFMKSSTDFFENKYRNPRDIINMNNEFLIHWAGDNREPIINRMNGAILLIFFKVEFEKRLTNIQKIESKLQDYINGITFLRKIKYLKNRLIIEIDKQWSQLK